MKELKEIRDDQIRVVGESVSKRPLSLVVSVAVVLVLLVAILVTVSVLFLKNKEDVSPVEQDVVAETVCIEVPLNGTVSCEAVDDCSAGRGFVEIKDTCINDVPMRLFIPHKAGMSLCIGKPDKNDSTIVFAAQAADIRADNGGIVGAFVLNGEPKAWGVSKRGFCASINGVVTIGMAKNTPLFEEATAEGGFFFRQYPLVSGGKLIDNEPKGKAVRRAICDRKGEIFMVESGLRESFHDFALALVDLGVDNAVYLVGSSAYGWAVDENGKKHEFGTENEYGSRIPKNINYILWKRL